MSREALALGVVDRLRDAFGDTEGEFVVKSDDLQPPAAACSFRTSPFVLTVGGASSAPGPSEGADANDEYYTLQVCVTAWMGFVPDDRQGGEAAADSDMTAFAQYLGDAQEYGLEGVGTAVGVFLRQNWATVAAANARIRGAGTTTNGFCEPFKRYTVGTVEDAPLTWVHSQGQSDAGEVKKLIVTLTGARRIRVQGTL